MSTTKQWTARHACPAPATEVGVQHQGEMVSDLDCSFMYVDEVHQFVPRKELAAPLGAWATNKKLKNHTANETTYLRCI